MKIPLAVPEDEARLAELELIFETEHRGWRKNELEKEAGELMRRFEIEAAKQQIEELSGRLAEMDENDANYEQILKQIRDLQKTTK